MIYSVRWQLLLSMVAVIMITVGMTALLANQAAIAEIEQAQEQVEAIRDQRLITLVTRAYLQNRRWEDSQQLLEYAAELYGGRVVITNNVRTVVADSHWTFIGRPLAPNISSRASYALSNDQGRLGTLLVNPELPAYSTAAAEFPRKGLISFLNIYLVLSGLLAVAVAMILTFFVSHRMLSRIESLARVSRLAAQRDFSARAEITSRDELGELSRTFNSMLEELSRTEEIRRNLVADVAHELRTPVTNIRGYVEGIGDGVISPDQATLDSIHSETLLLGRLIEDLQDLALAESGQMDLRIQPCHLGELVASAAASVQPLAQEKQVDLSVGQASKIVINADPQRISQVLRNLLVNAVTHTPADGQVLIQADQKNGHASITVKNTGAGIPPEDLPHIFDRFYRVDKSRSRSTGGVGLGLTITKHLVEAHGGTIEASSQEGQGTLMVVTLPLEPKS